MSFDAAGYLLRPTDGPDLWFLDTRMSIKAGGEQTHGAFALIEWAAPTGFAPPLHLHDREDEGFYLLEGEMTVECGERSWQAGPGDFAFLPRGIPHTILVTHGPARGLQITAPAGFDRFIAELGRPAEHPGLPTPAEPDLRRLIEAGERYGHQILGPPPSLSHTATTHTKEKP